MQMSQGFVFHVRTKGAKPILKFDVFFLPVGVNNGEIRKMSVDTAYLLVLELGNFFAVPAE